MPDRTVPVLTRELIYTAITRAKKKVEVWGEEEVFRLAVSRQIERISGLREALWG
jgi:exodeoxyribonuclease V alpha subunit